MRILSSLIPAFSMRRCLLTLFAATSTATASVGGFTFSHQTPSTHQSKSGKCLVPRHWHSWIKLQPFCSADDPSINSGSYRQSASRSRRPKLSVQSPILHTTTRNMATSESDGNAVSNANSEQNGKANCRRCLGTEGDNGKANDVIFCGTAPKPESNIIYFGGDVQDFTENMLAHRDNKHYEEWNLEGTAQLLCERFPNSHIWVVRPSKMHLKTFSCFANFVESNAIGVPEHSPGQKSWHHLQALLRGAVGKISEEFAPVNLSPSAELPVELVGFSKGCVVLNQLLYDLKEAKMEEPTQNFVKLVKRIHWLDGGHNGGSNTWITDERVLENLKGLDIRVASHVTPYQVKDAMRLWIGKEQKKFVERTRKLGVDVMNTLHFANVERSLDCHFKVLKKF